MPYFLSECPDDACSSSACPECHPPMLNGEPVEFVTYVSDELADKAEQDPTLHAALNALAARLAFDDGAS